MKMTRPYRIAAIVIGVLAVLGIGILWILRPPASYDSAKVAARPLALRQRFKKVRVSIVSDGGSIFVTIVDADDVGLRAYVPARIGDPRPYTRLFLGVPGQKVERYAEVKDPEHSMLMIQRVLCRFYDDDPAGAGIALVHLRGRLADYIRLSRHDLAGRM